MARKKRPRDFDTLLLSLPDDILVQIFRFTAPENLFSFGACCKRLRSIMKETVSCLRCQWIGNNSVKEIVQLAEQFVKIRKLELCTFPVADQDLILITHCLPGLNELSIDSSYLQIPDEEKGAQQRALMSANCQPAVLTVLRINNSSALTDIGLSSIAHQSTKLCTLDLSGCTAIPDGAFIALSPHWPLLKTVRLCGCSVSDAGISALVRNCTLLQSLDISNTNASCESIIAISACCKSLTTLSIAGLSSCNARCIELLGHNCPNIKSLNLRSCFTITDRDLFSLQELTSLKTLDITDISFADKGMQYIISIGERLRHLELTVPLDLRDEQQWRILSCACTQLRRLHLWGGNPRVDLLASCSTLRHLLLCSSLVTDEQMAIFAENSVMELRTLILYSMPLLTHVGMCALLRRCKSLRVFQMPYACMKCDMNIVLQFLSKQCVLLRHVDVTGRPVRLELIRELHQHCKLLSNILYSTP